MIQIENISVKQKYSISLWFNKDYTKENIIFGEDETMAPAELKAAEKIELLTIKECAEAVNGLSEHTVRQLIAQGKLPHIRTGAGKRGKILVPKAALLEYFGG